MDTTAAKLWMAGRNFSWMSQMLRYGQAHSRHVESLGVGLQESGFGRETAGEGGHGRRGKGGGRRGAGVIGRGGSERRR